MKFANLRIVQNRGRFSGNLRLDSSVLKEHDVDDPESRQMWLVDLHEDPDFYDEIRDNIKNWKAIISTTIAETKAIQLWFCGHSHLDVAYKWRYEQTIQKMRKTMAKAVSHCEQFPDNFLYTFSTPQVFDWLKRADPPLYEQVKHYIKTGQIELVGGSWVESDCNMPSGEAMVRQRLYGMKFFRDEFDRFPTIEFFPDCFGFNRGVPQVLAKSGAEFFMTNKMTWNQTNPFPLVHFWWESPDGSRLWSTLDSIGENIVSRWETFGPTRFCVKADGQKTWDYYCDLDLLEQNLDKTKPSVDIPIIKGKGDGGHGPTHRELAEMQASIKVANELGLNAKWGHLHELCASMRNKENELPLWRDELYLEDHQGTLTVHGEIKRHNRRLEGVLLGTELLGTLRMLSMGIQYPFERMEAAWKLVLLNQFHDVLPGSCIPEVVDDAADIWNHLDAELADITNIILLKSEDAPVSKNKGQITLFNPLAWKRSDRVFIPASVLGLTGSQTDWKPPYAQLEYTIKEEIFTTFCQPVEAEPLDLMQNHPAGWWVIVTLQAWGIAIGKLKIIPEQRTWTQAPEMHAEAGESPFLTNKITTIRLDPRTGGICQFTSVDVAAGGNLVKGSDSNLAIGFVDNSERYPAWNLTPEYWTHPKNYAQTDQVRISVADVGPVFVSLLIDRILGISPVRQILRLYRGDPKLYCIWAADWSEPNVLLKLPIVTALRSRESTAEGMYCVTKRSTHPKNRWDVARYEKTMHRFADLSNEDFSWGIALLNEGKYGYDTLEDNILRMSLHRSPEYPGPAGEAWALIERHTRLETEGTKPPTHIGLGPVSCRYAFYAHLHGALQTMDGDPNISVRQAAEEFNCPIVVFQSDPLKKTNDFDFHDIFVDWTPSHVWISALKPEEWNKNPAIIVRIAEQCGIGPVSVEIRLNPNFQHMIKDICPVDLLERDIKYDGIQFSWYPNSGQIRFRIRSFEIVSLKLILKH
jgi:alpha-mannosidase